MRYWVYMNGEVPGSFTPQELTALPGFSQTTLVCPAEGEILEKNWKRSGEFPELIPHLQEKQKKQAPLSPAPEASPGGDVDGLLDVASTRLFSHVADLMKELENRREERALTASLQRQLVDLKGQLQAEREKASMAESRLPLISELEESRRKDQIKLQTIEAALKGREDAMGELRMELEKTKNELDSTKRRLTETSNDLAIRNRLVDKISRDLTEKELSLAKALAVIRRLEEDLNRICPDTAAPAQPEPAAPPRAEAAPPVLMTAPENVAPSMPSTALEVPAAKLAYTTDEPPRAPTFLEPPMPENPAAQNALVDFFKRFMTKDGSH